MNVKSSPFVFFGTVRVFKILSQNIHPLVFFSNTIHILVVEVRNIALYPNFRHYIQTIVLFTEEEEEEEAAAVAVAVAVAVEVRKQALAFV